MAIKDKAPGPTIIYADDKTLSRIFNENVCGTTEEYTDETFNPAIFNMIHSIKSAKDIKDARFSNFRNN